MTRRLSYGLVAVTVVASLALAGAASAQGCAMCKTALGGPGDPLASGINTSILFMMAMPFVLFAGVGGWLTYMFWGHRPVAAGDLVERPETKLLGTEREGVR